jgi:hypothetical protein
MRGKGGGPMQSRAGPRSFGPCADHDCDRRENRVRAGALTLAVLERLVRISTKAP